MLRILKNFEPVKIKKFWFDVETTGVDSKTNGIIQIAIMIEIDGVVYEKQSFNVCPWGDCVYDEKALAVNGINKKDIFQYPTEEETYLKIIKLMDKYSSKWDKKDKFFTVGFNVRFDLDFLSEFFLRNHDKYLFSRIWGNPIDVMTIAGEVLNPIRHFMENFKLTTVIKELEINCLEGNLHDALYDIEMTREVYSKCKKIINCDLSYENEPELKEAVIQPSLDELKTSFLTPPDTTFVSAEPPVFKQQENFIVSWDFVIWFGRYKNKKIADILNIDASYLLWLHDNNIQNIEFSEKLYLEIKKTTDSQPKQKPTYKKQYPGFVPPYVKDENFPTDFACGNFDDQPF